MEGMLPGDSAACRTHKAPSDAKRDDVMRHEVEGTGEAGDDVLKEGVEQDAVVVAVVEDTVGVEVGMEDDMTETSGEGEVLDVPKAAVVTTATAAGGNEDELAGTGWERGGSSASRAAVSGGGESAMIIASSSSDCAVLFAELTDLVSNDVTADVADVLAADETEETVPDTADEVCDTDDTEERTLEIREAEEVSVLVAKDIVEVVTAGPAFNKEMAMGAVVLVGAVSLAEEDKRDAVEGNAILVLVADDVLVPVQQGTRMISGPSREEARCDEEAGVACRMMMEPPRMADITGTGWLRFTWARLTAPTGTEDT